MDRGSQHGWQGDGISPVVASTSAPPDVRPTGGPSGSVALDGHAPPGVRPTGRPNGSVALDGHAPRIRAGVDPRRVVHDGRNGRAPDGDRQGRPGETIRRAATGTPRRTILLIALLTAVVAASVALAAGWLAGVFAAFAGSIVAYTVTGVAARREATQRAAQEAVIAAAQRAAVGVAVAALGERDIATADHSDDVVELAAALGDRMRVDDEERRRLLVAAQLHDLGKVAVPTEILHKPGPLDDDEWEVMRSHTPVGERILRSVPELADVATIVRHSHEHYDGSGYPDGLAGRQIPLSSRIILCADAYHAIRSNRPYRAGRSAAEALTEIRTHAGRQFDPQVAAALEHAASDARRGRVLSGASLTGSRRLAALLLVLSIGSGAAMAADGPARSMIEDVYAAGPIATSDNATGPGQPCLVLDPSSAVCAPGLPMLSEAAPGLARARFGGVGGGGQAAAGSGPGAAAGPGSARLATMSGAGLLPVIGVVLPEWAARPPVGAIGSPAVGGGGGGPGSGASPGQFVGPPAGAADPRPIIWPGTPAAAESQNAGGPVATPGASGPSGTPGANGPAGTPGADGTAGTPGGGTPGGGAAPAPGAVPGAGAGDDRGKKRGRKGRRGRGRGGGDHRGGRREENDEGSPGLGGRGERGGGGKGERGEGNRGGGAPSGGGSGEDHAEARGGKGGGAQGKGGGGEGDAGKGKGGGGEGNAGQGGGGSGGGSGESKSSGGGGGGGGSSGGGKGNSGKGGGNGNGHGGKGNGGGNSAGGGGGKGKGGD